MIVHVFVSFWMIKSFNDYSSALVVYGLTMDEKSHTLDWAEILIHDDNIVIYNIYQIFIFVLFF